MTRIGDIRRREGYFNVAAVRSSHSFAYCVFPRMALSHHSAENRHCEVVDDVFAQRLVLGAILLSGVAICAGTLLVPVLINELDELSELARREAKEFKGMADQIWEELMRTQGRPESGRPLSSPGVLMLLQQRGRRELQTTPGDQNGFLERLERKSYKGRKRNKLPKQYWELSRVIPPRLPPPQSSATTAFPRVALSAPIRQQDTNGAASGVKRSPKCPKGAPGLAGVPGQDGVPGIDGVPGAPGQSGAEVQQSYSSKGTAAKCVQCPAGPPGVPGLRGGTGAPGDPGVNGLPGVPKQRALAGPPGPIGEPGLDGVNGTDGVNGFPGSPGIKYSIGPAGARGEVGPAGEPGQPGDYGQEGRPGPAGEPGWPGHPGLPGRQGSPGPIGPEGIPGIPGAERHYCSCPVRTSQLMRLKDLPGGVDYYLGRWKGRVPNQLIHEYEKFTKERDEEFQRIKQPLVEVQNRK